MVYGSQQTGALLGGNEATDARLWAAAQRHVLQCDRDRRMGRACRWRTFSDSFRAYSTALSPRWARLGIMCHPSGGLFAGRPMCDVARLRRRARVSSLSWRWFDQHAPGLRRYLERWARGERANNVPRACHTDQLATRPAGAVVPRGSSNWYNCDHESCAWPADYVRIVPVVDDAASR
jgi:hypothetical protein